MHETVSDRTLNLVGFENTALHKASFWEKKKQQNSNSNAVSK